MFTNLKVLLGTVWSPTIETVESRFIGESLSPSLDIAINRMVERGKNAIVEHLLQRSYHPHTLTRIPPGIVIQQFQWAL